MRRAIAIGARLAREAREACARHGRLGLAAVLLAAAALAPFAAGLFLAGAALRGRGPAARRARAARRRARRTTSSCSRTRTRSRSSSASTASTPTSRCGRRLRICSPPTARSRSAARGVYVGQRPHTRVLALDGSGVPASRAGCIDQMQLQPIVHVAPDGRTAKARWRMFAQEAVSGRVRALGRRRVTRTSTSRRTASGRSRTCIFSRRCTRRTRTVGARRPCRTRSRRRLPPDRPPTVDYKPYPAVFVVPFHYENPVTGAPVHADLRPRLARPRRRRARTRSPWRSTALDRRLGLLEDLTSARALNSIYGYYLARNAVGRSHRHLLADRRDRDRDARRLPRRGEHAPQLGSLRQAPAAQHGLLHNHMQFQPVIDVAPDGQSAKMRSRALSIMGQFEGYTHVDGRRLRERLRQGRRRLEDQARSGVQYVFRAVRGGLERLSRRGRRPASRSPIRPTRRRRCRSRCTRRPFLPPFHYANPVTGRPPRDGAGGTNEAERAERAPNHAGAST